MNASGTITMSMTELDRLKVVQAVCERRLKPGQAADRLALSVRQVERLVLRYEAAGVAGLVSGRRGRPGNHQLPEGMAPRALAVIRERYADFGPTLACEKLWECHGIGLSVETVRALMIAAGLWIPRKDRPPRVYQPRNRRACLGELIQIDGSDHRWFEERAPACTLLVFIDDATGRLMALHFTAPNRPSAILRPFRSIWRHTASPSHSIATSSASSTSRIGRARLARESHSSAAPCTSSISRRSVRTRARPRVVSSAPT
ncbi:hypothetical protein OKW46_007744 [Paraburkholderia sp. WSM4179]|nr:hypothetical protein [Paraburkholderia sp. WSM4179]